MKLLFVFILLQVVFAQTKYVNDTTNTVLGKTVYKNATEEEIGNTATTKYTADEIKNKHGYYIITGTGDNCVNENTTTLLMTYELNTCITENNENFTYTRNGTNITKTYYTNCTEQKTQSTPTPAEYTCNTCNGTTKIYCNDTSIIPPSTPVTPPTETKYVNDTSNTVTGKIVYKIDTANTSGAITADEIQKRYGYYMKEGNATATDCSNLTDSNITIYVLDECITENNNYFIYTRNATHVTKTNYTNCAKEKAPQGSETYNNGTCNGKVMVYIENEPKYVKDTVKSQNGKIVYNVSAIGTLTAKDIQKTYGYYMKTGNEDTCIDQFSSEIYLYELDKCITERTAYFIYTRNGTNITKTSYTNNTCTEQKTPATTSEYKCNTCSGTTKIYCNDTSIISPSTPPAEQQPTETKYVKDTSITGKIVYKIDKANTTGAITADDIQKKYGYYMKEGSDANCGDHATQNITIYVLDECITEEGKYFIYTRNATHVTKTNYTNCTNEKAPQGSETYNNGTCNNKVMAYIETEPKYIEETPAGIDGKKVYKVSPTGNITIETIKANNDIYIKNGTSTDCFDQFSSEIVAYNLSKCITEGNENFTYTRNATHVTKTYYTNCTEQKTQSTTTPAEYKCNSCNNGVMVYCNETSTPEQKPTKYIKDTTKSTDGKIVFTLALNGTMTSEEIQKDYGYYIQNTTGNGCQENNSSDITVYILNKCIKEEGKFIMYVRSYRDIEKNNYTDGNCTTKTNNLIKYNCSECDSKNSTKVFCGVFSPYYKQINSNITNKYLYTVTNETNVTIGTNKYALQILTQKNGCGYYFKKGSNADCSDQWNEDIYLYNLSKCITENNETFIITRDNKTITKTLYNDTDCKTVKTNTTSNKTIIETYQCGKCHNGIFVECRNLYPDEISNSTEDNSICDSVYGCEGYVELESKPAKGFGYKIFGRLGVCYDEKVKYIFNVSDGNKIYQCDCQRKNCIVKTDKIKYNSEYDFPTHKLFLKKGRDDCYNQTYEKIYLITEDTNCVNFGGNNTDNYKFTIKSGEKSYKYSIYANNDDCKATPKDNNKDIDLKCYTCSVKDVAKNKGVNGIKGYCPAQRPPAASGSSSLLILFMISLLFFIF